MKKLLIILFGILFLCGCNYDKQVEPIKDNIVNDVKEEVKEEYEDNNPIKVGLFLADDSNYHNKNKLVDTYYTNFTSGKDIGSFEVFLLMIMLLMVIDLKILGISIIICMKILMITKLVLILNLY